MNEQSSINSTSYTEPHVATDYKSRSLGFYHQNNRGTGTAMRLEPRVNRDDSDRYNCFFIEMAGQKSAARREAGGVVPATFDWNSKITVKLNFMDIAELLTVLEGKALRIGGERNGLFHANGASNTLISFQRNPDQGTYYFALSCKRGKDDAPQKLGIMLSEAEATGLRCLFQTGLFFLSFSSLLRERPLDRRMTVQAGAHTQLATTRKAA